MKKTILTELNRKVILPDGTVLNRPYAELTDIYNEKVPEEEVLLKDKIFDSVYEYVTVKEDGTEKQYTMPWMRSLVSLVVNKDVIPSAGTWGSGNAFTKLPNTTEELFAYMDALPADVTPMIHSIDSSYWDIAYPVWLNQYYGTEGMDKYYTGYNPDMPDDESARYQPEMFASDGLWEALKLYEKIVNPDNGYQDEDTVLDFTSVQNKFLETENKILFMPNGLWLEREMEANYDASELNIEYMKMPVISALGTKLGIDDATLSAIVDYIDGNAATAPSVTSTKGLTSEDVIATVKDARQMNAGNYFIQSVIPAYSTKIDLAKDFLQIMASDRGMEAMLSEMGSCAPFDYSNEKLKALHDAGKMSDFTYTANVIINNGKYTFGYMDDLFMKNSLYDFNKTEQPIAAWFAAPDAGDRTSVGSLFQEHLTYCQGMWDSWLRTAGIQK